jgi:hypothetical protein
MHPRTRIPCRGGTATALLLGFGLALGSGGCADAAGDARAAERQNTPHDDLIVALTAGLDSLSDASLDSVYMRPAAPLSVEDGGLTATGRSALDALAGAQAEGMATTRYGVMFPNPHDTPVDHLFVDRMRTFSHACVRPERLVDLAHLLLREASRHPPSEFESGAPTFTSDVYDRNAEARQAPASAMAPEEERP